jgi:hypothetical protein
MKLCSVMTAEASSIKNSVPLVLSNGVGHRTDGVRCGLFHARQASVERGPVKG